MNRAAQFDWYLAEWMAATRMSQADLCRETGFPKAKMSELVNGVSRYNRDVVNTLARALHIRPYELLMHPRYANAIRQFRETAATIVSVELPEAEQVEATSSEKPKKVS